MRLAIRCKHSELGKLRPTRGPAIASVLALSAHSTMQEFRHDHHHQTKFKRIPGLRGDMTTTAFACRRKFLRFFAEGFRDETYETWERGYKYRAHTQWNDALSQHNFRQLLDVGKFGYIAAHATRIESRTNLLFSFEKMALRDAVRSTEGAKVFARGLYAFLHSDGPKQRRFEEWCATVATVPRKQTRVLTWPLVTVFGFIAQPETHMFLKPRVTQLAADAYGVEFLYRSKPNWIPINRYSFSRGAFCTINAIYIRRT
jgi:hypothetical protein